MKEDRGVLAYSLSSRDIQDLLPGVDVKLYGELSDVRRLDELFENPWNATVLLYETSEGYGHWVCVLRRGKRVVECFDSYGYVPDDQLGFIPATFRRKSEQDYPHLTKLLYESGYNVHYNDHPLQSHRKGVNTCGRWVVYRIRNAKLSEDAFANKVQRDAKRSGYSLDGWVTREVPVEKV